MQEKLNWSKTRHKGIGPNQRLGKRRDIAPTAPETASTTPKTLEARRGRAIRKQSPGTKENKKVVMFVFVNLVMFGANVFGFGTT